MGIMEQPRCPKCGGYNVQRVPGAGIICNECGYGGAPKKEPPKLRG